MISKHDIVRIKVGKYQGQTARVSIIDGRRMRGSAKRGYRLITIGPPLYGLGYFIAEELELVLRGGSQEASHNQVGCSRWERCDTQTRPSQCPPTSEQPTVVRFIELRRSAMSVKMLPLASGTLVPVPVCEVCSEIADEPEPVSTRTINQISYRFYTCEKHWRQVKRIARSFTASQAQGYQAVRE